MTFRRRADSDFAEEVAAHIEIEAERLRAEGHTPAEADALARRAFGNVTAARERFHEDRPFAWVEALAADIRYALRTLRLAPGYAAAAILALALGLGANVAIFSVIDEVLLRPPAVPRANELAQVYSFNRKTAAYVSSSYLDYADFRAARSFRRLAAYVRLPLTVQPGAAPAERVSVEAVTGNYFDMLGVAPALGRPLAESDDRPGAAPVAMVAEEFWRTRLGADPNAIGRTIAIGDSRFTLIGVAPRTVGGMNLNWATPPRVWIPLHTVGAVIPRMAAARPFENRAMLWLVVTGRLNPGVSTAAAQSELESIASRSNRGLTAVVFPLSRSKFWPSYRNDIRRTLSGFAIAAGLILLLACANVSNLLLGRAIARQREVAVRLAIGAGRGRLVRQLLTESAVLAALSAAAALAVARLAMMLLLKFPAALGLPLFLDLRLEPRALAICLALATLTLALFSLAPAFRSSRLDILPALRQSGNAPPGGPRDWLRSGLIAAQAALAMILLAGGGVYGRTLLRAYAVDLGFDAGRLLTAEFSLPAPGSEASGGMWRAQQELLERLAATPGVASASVSSAAILSGVRLKATVDRGPVTTPITATCEFVGRDFLRTMGIPLTAGDAALTDAGAVVNRALAAALNAGVGQSIVVDAPGRGRSAVTISGIARDAHYGNLWDAPEPHVYLAARPSDAPPGNLMVRTTLPPASVSPEVRKLWGAIAPASPLSDIQPATERVDAALTPQRVAAGILGGFGALALILTALGLYSVVAFTVARQTREIGIRVAIGAPPAAVFGAIFRRAVAPAVFGLAAGAAASLPLMRVLASNAKAVSPYDGPAYGAAALLLAAAACAAAIAPARRASRVDPSMALRAD